MRLKKYYSRSLLIICLAGGASAAVAKEIMIFIGTDEYPPQNTAAASAAGVGLGIYNLDAQRTLETRLMQKLPADQASAQRIVGERFNALTQDEVQAIFRPVALVAQWDIRQVPAFVFDDGATVIYGLTDVGQALNYWRTWRQGTRTTTKATRTTQPIEKRP